MHLDKVNAFEERCKRFGDWADGVERRIGGGGGSSSSGEQVSPSRLGISYARQSKKSDCLIRQQGSLSHSNYPQCEISCLSSSPPNTIISEMPCQ